MKQLFQDNRRAAWLMVGALTVLLAASVLSACQVEDLIKIDVPEDVAKAIGSEERIPVSRSSEAWEDWVAWVDRESERFAERIDEGQEVAGVIRSLTETGLQIGQDAASTLPGGAAIATVLAGLGGLFLRRPGDQKREALEKEASYNAGLEKGRDLAEGLEALREGLSEGAD